MVVMTKRRSGFTIVELLIVIVVIGILATITVVAYTGIQRNAKIGVIKSDLQTAQRQLQLDQVNRAAFVEDLGLLNDNTGLKFTPGATLYYSFYNEAEPQDFCLTAVIDDLQYKITAHEPVTEGACNDQMPTAPALSTNADSATQITVSWDAVQNATGYRIELSTADSFTGDGTGACSAPTCYTGVTGTSQVFSGLTQNTDYYFRAFTINPFGVSDESDHVMETTGATTPAGAPTLSSGTATCSTRTIPVSWTAISPVTSYTIRYSTTTGFTSSVWTVTDITALTYTITANINCGTTYYIQVAAVNGSMGPWSNKVTKVTPISAPGTPSVSATYPGSTRAGSASYWAQSYDGEPGGSGTWYYAQASLSGSSCSASGTTRQFRVRTQYNSPTTWGPWTSWNSSSNWYAVGPLPGYGIRFAVQARCYTSATVSSTSSTGYGCRWRSGSTSCSGF